MVTRALKGTWGRATENADSMDVLKAHFDEVHVQSSSLEMNLMDAGLFAFMQNLADAECASALAEIRAAVHKAWRITKPEHLTRVSDRVRRNIAQVTRLKGGFHVER